MTISKSDPKWALLIAGKLSHKFKTISAHMLLSRLEREYKDSPTPEKMSILVEEAFAFFLKYRNLFNEDLREIFQ